MGLFSRNKEAADGLRVDDVAFDALRRSPRSARTAAHQAARSSRDGVGDSTAPLDPAETAKSRARHRLIGAVALALVAIVFVPMLFDRAPVPTSDDISLQIPDRDSPFEGRRGVPDASSGPLKASSELPVVPASPSPVVSAPPPTTKAVVEPPAAPAAEKVAEPVGAKTIEPKPAEKSVVKPVPEKTVDSDASRPGPATDDPKALAALEGKGATAPTAAVEGAGGRSYAVQIAAFSTPEKARNLRDQLVANGLKSYTESVATKEGLRTRVRLGPFASREAADSARQKLKTMKLDGPVVPL